MADVLESPQRIARLTPVADVAALIDRQVKPVAPCRRDIASAPGRTLAAAVTVADPRPASPLALRDGWALASEETIDAGAYAPAILTRAPVLVEAGDALPDGADAVADLDTVRARQHAYDVLAAVAPGDGVLLPAGDAAPGEPLRGAEILRRTDIAALRALGIETVSVREPRLRVASVRANPIVNATVGWLADMARADGGVADAVSPADDVEAVLTRGGADLIVIVGGTGRGGRDRSVEALARVGQVECHGIALAPGETTAFGRVGETPVLVVPGRLDAALAAWLVLGRRIMARLARRADEESTLPCNLSRKLVSSVGLSELVLLRRDGDTVAPLASGYLPLSALTQADGYVVVPPDSEGLPAGARIAMRPLP